jgi:hypothetical protein
MFVARCVRAKRADVMNVSAVQRRIERKQKGPA